MVATIILATLLATGLVFSVSVAEGLVLLVVLLTPLTIRIARVLIPILRVKIDSWPARIELTEMNLARKARPAPEVRESLCTTCVFAHVVRGYGRGEEIVACGYAFPQRDILFAVRECTDHKLKRESSGAESADEGAVRLPSLEVTATPARAAVAARQACGT